MISAVFNRQQMLQRLRANASWDIVVIGGGATGLGIALDAASRGHSTLLLEQHDFAKGTSSRSTKLVHGGVRYLAQGNIRLVYGALRERGILLRNAPHLVKRLSFIIPCYTAQDAIVYTTGLKFYDLLSGSHSFGKSVFLPAAKVSQRLPNINPNRLAGGVEYFDGQFDDARLAINIAQTASEQGAVLLNYCGVTGLQKDSGKISGVMATDHLTGETFSVSARSVVNATGVFVDGILQMDKPDRAPVVTTSQGIHIVIDRSFMPSHSALMIPKTSDGRVVFAVPWQDHLIVGTTDQPRHPADPLEPQAEEQEIEFLLDTIRRFLVRLPERRDIRSVFAGLRPLAAPTHNQRKTKEISRDHKLIVSDTGLVTITGGKWTTYRKMAEETVNACQLSGRLKSAKPVTAALPLHGYVTKASGSSLSGYGADEPHILELIARAPQLSEKLVAGHAYSLAEVIWAVRAEMAMTVEDVLSRRLRLLFVDAHAAVEAAPKVAALLMKELHLSDEWAQRQVQQFKALARHYLIN